LQIAEQRKAYVEKKNEEVKMWERSYEDLEIIAREFEKEVSLPHLLFLLVLIRHFSLFLKNGFFFAISPKVNIMKEEAEHQRRQRGNIEVELQNVRQQLRAVTSSGKVGSFLEDGIVDLADATRFALL
jgi:hypothetical protein